MLKDLIGFKGLLSILYYFKLYYISVLDNCKCRDSLSSSRVATISIIQHGVTISKDISDCKEIARYYAQFCQKIHLGGKKNACCKSCQGVGKHPMLYIFLFIYFGFHVAFNTLYRSYHDRSFMGRGNQCIQLVLVVFYKLLTNGKQLPPPLSLT